MTKLEKLYSIIENSKDVGVKLPKDVIKQVEELEEGIIKNEILPALSEDIAPRLNPIKRNLVLVVEYHPGEPITVALSRKAKISDFVDAKQITPVHSQPVSGGAVLPKEEHVPSKHIENPTKGLRVTFPDGTVVWHNSAIGTFIETLRIIGFERISQLSIIHAGYNLVGKQKRPTEPGKVWQHEADGYYIYSNIGNATKIEDLKKIAKAFHINLKIEEVKPKK